MAVVECLAVPAAPPASIGPGATAFHLSAFALAGLGGKVALVAAIDSAADRLLRIGNRRFRPRSAGELGANVPAGNPTSGDTRT
jgi:hypothetical protein